MLYPSQHRRLQGERVPAIAGEIRHIQTGFGDYRFNAPTPVNLRPLLALYASRVQTLLTHVDSDSIYDLVSFAQYYFALLHPFYERCGRTSEELMYLLFAQLGYGWRYISATGDRSSPLAHERMVLLNKHVEDFNRRIALHFGLSPLGIRKTPDIYRALVVAYFTGQYEHIYAIEPERPYYYLHPIPEITTAYYFLMEALLLDEIAGFDLKQPYAHIRQLGQHLRESGNREYTGEVLTTEMVGDLQAVLSGLAMQPMVA